MKLSINYDMIIGDLRKAAQQASNDDLEDIAGMLDKGAITIYILNEENKKLQEASDLYHDVMDALIRTKLPHGTCLPRSLRACTHCAGQEQLEEMIQSYRGRKVVLS